ncbi:hypothetical protein ACTACK_18045 [Pseudomonas syringae]|uniref:hypothetical protein n=1 Tax=Pseudomonas syringae TaxID=317 RepID=UPI003F751A24
MITGMEPEMESEMSSEREIALKQALLAVLGAAKEEGFDVNRLIERSTELLIDNSKYRQVDHPYSDAAILEINLAYADLIAIQ